MRTSSVYLESLLAHALLTVFADPAVGEHPRIKAAELAAKLAAKVVEMKSQAPLPALTKE